MHIAFIQLEYDHFNNPEQLFNGSFTVVEWARALSKIGVEVTVIYRFRENITFEKEGISFCLIKDFLPSSVAWYQVHFQFYLKLSRILKARNIDVIQVHNLKSIVPNFFFTRHFSKIPVLVQDHGSTLNGDNSLKSNIYNLILRLSLSNADGIIFSSKGQEKRWIEKRIFKREKCFFVMENSSSFYPMDKIISKNSTGLDSEIVFLWVGNLDKNKDPFTVLTAFSEFFKKEENAKLYMVYRNNLLEKDVKQLIENRTALKGKVEMIGAVERSKLVEYYSSSDFIVSGSHKEGSGYSVIEAMSCGVIPILTSIPSFLDLTNNGYLGEIYEVGNSRMLEKALFKVQQMNREQERIKVLDFFKLNLSYSSLAHKAIQVYETLI